MRPNFRNLNPPSPGHGVAVAECNGEKIEDAKAQALREKAERHGLKLEQLLTASVEDLIGQPNADFDEAARRVLSKNQELYRRLA